MWAVLFFLNMALFLAVVLGGYKPSPYFVAGTAYLALAVAALAHHLNRK